MDLNKQQNVHPHRHTNKTIVGNEVKPFAIFSTLLETKFADPSAHISFLKGTS
jgi:hypothetical protein